MSDDLALTDTGRAYLPGLLVLLAVAAVARAVAPSLPRVDELLVAIVLAVLG